MALATLSIDLEARLAKLEAGLDKAGRMAEREAARMKASFGGLEGSLAKLGALAAGAFSAGTIVAFANETSRSLLAIKDLSEATGSAIEKISGLEDAVRAAGGDFAAAGGILIKFNGILSDLETNKEAAGVFKALGLDAAELKRLDPADALQRTARALAQFRDDGSRARAIQVLFSRSVAEAGPLLRELAEAGDLNGKVTKEQVEQADRFNKELAKLEMHANDAGRAISGPLVKALNDMADTMRTGGIGEALERNVISPLKQVTTAYRILGIGIQRQLLARELEKTPEDSALRDQIRALDDQARKLAESFNNARAAWLGLNSQAGAGRGFINPPLVDLPELKLPALESEASKRLHKLLEDHREEQRKLSFVTLDFGSEQSEAETQRLLRLQQVAEDVLGKIDADAERTRRQLEQITLVLRDVDGNYIFDLGPNQSEAETKRLERLNEVLANTPQALRDLNEKLKDSKRFASDLGLTFSSAFEDAIVQGGNLRDLLLGLEQDILRIVTRKLVTEPLGNAITDLLKGATGGSGGGSAGFGNFFAQMFQRLFAGFFAEGGYIAPGHWGVVGERGPELVAGGRRGVTVQPMAAGGMTVQQHFHLSGPVDRRTVGQLRAEAGRGVQQAMARNL